MLRNLFRRFKMACRQVCYKVLFHGFTRCVTILHLVDVAQYPIPRAKVLRDIVTLKYTATLLSDGNGRSGSSPVEWTLVAPSASAKPNFIAQRGTHSPVHLRHNRGPSVYAIERLSGLRHAYLERISQT